MTKGLEELLNLPPLDDVLKRQGVNLDPDKPEPQQEEVGKTLTALRDLSARMAMLDGTDHAEGMDELYSEIAQHARDLMAYGYNVDMPRQRGIFEIASLMYGHAISAKNSKRDAQLKTMRLALERRRVELEEKRTIHALGQGQTTMIDDGTIIVEDRNELIRKLREQTKV